MSEPLWRLRPVREADRRTVADLLAGADLPVEGLEEQFGEGYVVAELDGRIVGAGGIEVHGRSGLLRSVVVREEARGRGLGQLIVNDRLRWSARKGLRAVYLLTLTVPEFFAHMGFTEMKRHEMPDEIQESREYSEICPATATAMVIRLDPLC
jgi:N-acetylglutamate synthase-like GNAT family acetyltransferase